MLKRDQRLFNAGAAFFKRNRETKDDFLKTYLALFNLISLYNVLLFDEADVLTR
jgi:hypothetical protein